MKKRTSLHYFLLGCLQMTWNEKHEHLILVFSSSRPFKNTKQAEVFFLALQRERRTGLGCRVSREMRSD